MAVWEVDCYRRPLQDEAGNPLWELVVCEADSTFAWSAFCPQLQINAEWVVEQLRHLLSDRPPPQKICVFRPQTLNLLEPACIQLEIPLQPTRHTPRLKSYLQELASRYRKHPGYTRQPYEPVALDQPPPLPLDETLWGNQWQFAALPAGEIADAFTGRMIPILEMPKSLLPLNLGLASTVPVPGVVIEGGRQSLRLAQWLQETRPVALSYIPGSPDGLILEAGLVDRWVIATFEVPDVAASATEFEQRKIASRGLHFLLVQPDNSGVTYSGFWLLQAI
ncbi:MAG: Tab2/Atab2 family RNA-binding protein [Oscillatoriales cyanobacterium C42_A2020_001]|nr:Tab2/Atab2 family RNA-binding protein [Leptolyngbyaceae cyanobacterium C42_A2020_001]